MLAPRANLFDSNMYMLAKSRWTMSKGWLTSSTRNLLSNSHELGTVISINLPVKPVHAAHSDRLPPQRLRCNGWWGPSSRCSQRFPLFTLVFSFNYASNYPDSQFYDSQTLRQHSSISTLSLQQSEPAKRSLRGITPPHQRHQIYIHANTHT